MNNTVAFVTAVLAGGVARGTSIAFAAMGETLAERSGIINLGVEGMMLMGAMTGVAVQVKTGSLIASLVGAGLAAAALAALHAYIVIFLNGNQIVSGIALSITGTGLSGYLGRPFVGAHFKGVDTWNVPVLSHIPFLGHILFRQNSMLYLAILTGFGVWFLLYRSRLGLAIRAVGENPEAAYSLGVQVRKARFIAVVLGGFLAGIGGAHLSLAYSQIWAEQMTAGEGWIAVGLVVVAGWNPVKALIVSLLFGAVTILHSQLQASGIEVSSYIIAMLPYLFSIAALTIATMGYRRTGQGLPAALAHELKIERN